MRRQSFGRGSWFSMVLVVLAVTAAPATAQVPGLVARWTFDGSNGADSSGNALDLTLHGPADFTAGWSGTALALGGTNAWGDHDASTAFVPGPRPWSVTAWVRPASGSSLRETIVSWYRCGANPLCSGPDAALYNISITAEGRPSWALRDNSGTDCITEGPIALVPGDWSHLAGTWDPATSRATLYVNGVVGDTAHAPLGRLDAGGVGVPLEVGRTYRVGWGFPGEYFAGLLDDVRIYQIALSASEVAALASPGSVGAPDLAPVGFALGAPAPNPARGRTTIAYRLAQPADVRLVVHDVAGRTVAVLAEGPREAGEHAAEWDGRDGSGRPVGGGVYFYRLVAGSGALVRRGAVLR